jgi:predicted metal-binding membrane protein
MALLFFAGIMNTVWIAGLTLYVALEKMVPHARPLSFACGAILTAAGLLVLAGAI